MRVAKGWLACVFPPYDQKGTPIATAILWDE